MKRIEIVSALLMVGLLLGAAVAQRESSLALAPEAKSSLSAPTIKTVNLKGDLPFSVEISSNSDVAKKWQGGFTDIFTYPGVCTTATVPRRQIATLLPFGFTFTAPLNAYGSSCFYIVYFLSGQQMGPADLITVTLTAPKPVKTK